MNTPARRGGGPLEPRRGPGRGGGPWDWDPLAELRRLRRDTDADRAGDQGTAPAWGGVAWGPAVEEEETDDAYEIHARLPGVPRERIAVDIDAHELRISGELGEEERARTLSRPDGRFLYRTTLPAGADPERAEAELTDGVLRVRMPKSATPKRRRLRIGGTDDGTGVGTGVGTDPATGRTAQATEPSGSAGPAGTAGPAEATEAAAPASGRPARAAEHETHRNTDRTGADT
ncbi:Hsp20/alpha crystallin family protein [Streptomyces sp. JB150]|uniref:Hsp20/alpha crystallin family protein n=1 Tax=Streptomyces sp. JB150 TaxID=2714844 RepID=UPI00140C14CF|nr:Hsp20/alpha crystallin family protein [Streptomyces sp. JB150]QIJ65576.1 Hsp20/alpha crystallin family protein [Streptomyces sp. JB150]